MSTRGLIGFRHQDADKLIYNHSDSHPDSLGLRILKELHAVKDWGAVRQRISGLHGVPETRKLDEHSSMAETEIRRYFPELKHRGTPMDFYDLYQPLQGSLKPYLEGKLMFMPDASDFIYNSLFCEWAYIANLDSNQFEIWKGLQTKPNNENRYGADPDRMAYYPCNMLIGYDLNNLPDPIRFMADYKLYQDISSAAERQS